MSDDSQFHGVVRFLNTRFPGYFLLYLSLILTFLLIGLGLLFKENSLIVGGFILLAAALLLLGLILWTGQIIRNPSQYQTQELLFSMSQSDQTDRLAYIDLGLRQGAISLSRHLTSGTITVIDVYNPQLMGSTALVKARQQAPSALNDKRIHWYDGRLDLLPLPDQSVSAVFIPHILSFFNQYGDQKKLLLEVYRILQANGRLLFAETVRNRKNRLDLLSIPVGKYPIKHWQTLLTDAGFDIRRQESLDGITFCLRADKPSPYTGRQMSLDLNFDKLR